MTHEVWIGGGVGKTDVQGRLDRGRDWGGGLESPVSPESREGSRNVVKGLG